MNFVSCYRLRTASPLLMVIAMQGHAWSQVNENLELKEAQTAMQLSAIRIADLEQNQLKAQQQNIAVTESLAAANAEAKETREAYEKLRIQMEGLGVAALDGSNVELQQRLLIALSDLRVLEQQKRELADALMALSETALAMAKASHEEPAAADAARKALEPALVNAEKALSRLQAQPEEESTGTLQNASVVSLKEDVGIAVFNIGSKHGVHPGMPLSVYRRDKPVARALVVDVRSGVCGAVIQDLISKDNPVKVGDIGKVESIKG